MVYDFIKEKQPVTENHIVTRFGRVIAKKYPSILSDETKVQKIDRFYVTDPASNKALRQVEKYNLVLEFFRLMSEFGRNLSCVGIKISERTNRDEELSKYISKTIDFTQIGDFAELKQIELQLELFKKTEDLGEQVKIVLDIFPKVQALRPFIFRIVKAMKKYRTIKRVNNDPEVLKALEELEKCPFCHEDIADWWNLQVIRLKKGLPIQMPDKN